MNRWSPALTAPTLFLIMAALGPVSAPAQLELGDLLVVDDSSNACPHFRGAVFKVDLVSNDLTLFACPSDGPPDAIAINPDGRIFINGAGNSPCGLGEMPLFEINPDNSAVSIATCAQTNWDELAVDGFGKLLVIDGSHDACGPLKGAVLEFSVNGFGLTGGPWCRADWFSPHSLSVDVDGTVLVSTTVQGGTAKLYRIDRSTGVVALEGDMTGTSIAGHLMVAGDGRIFLTDWSGPPGCFRGDVKTVDGESGATTSFGCSGDFWFPNGITQGPGGDLFIADRDSQICQVGTGTVWRMDSGSGAILDNYCHSESFNPTEIAVWFDPTSIFADGFESGDPSAWSAVAP
jgi:hypothetical protein